MPATPAFDPGDYPEMRDKTDIETERAEVDRQIASLLRMATDIEYRRAAVERLQQRRRDDARRLQIHEVTRPDRVDLLVARNSVIARGPDLTPDLQDRLQRDYGISAPADARRVVRLDVPSEQLEGCDVLSLVASMCGCGAPVSPNHVVPLSGVMKGAGGPEPSAGARPFPAVRFDRADPDLPLPVVAVLDTGVSAEARGDGYLAMAVAEADIDLLDDFPPDGLLDAGAGHGAFVAGVVQQVAPDATIRILKVLDSDGITTDAEVADRMRAAVEAGAQILNMSLGTETVDDDPPPALLDVVTDLAENHPDVVIVCAAGNAANTERMWPAAFAVTFPNVVAVAALDPEGAGAPWSSHGDWITCSAIGEGVVSTYVIGTEDGDLIDDPNPDTYGKNAWATWSGTSFAAPQITGAIVRICGETGLSPRHALANLLARGSEVTGYGVALHILPGTPDLTTS